LKGKELQTGLESSETHHFGRNGFLHDEDAVDEPRFRVKVEASGIFSGWVLTMLMMPLTMDGNA
jgi:hypothetical protein